MTMEVQRGGARGGADGYIGTIFRAKDGRRTKELCDDDDEEKERSDQLFVGLHLTTSLLPAYFRGRLWRCCC